MALCPETLDVTLVKPLYAPEGLFRQGVLQLSELFVQFIREVGKALSEITKEQPARRFTARNGVVIEMEFDVCDDPECMEDDGHQRVFR